MLLKFLLPSKVVAEAFINPMKDQQLDDLITVSHEVRTQEGKTFVSIFYQSETVPGLLHFAKRWAMVLEQGTSKIWGGEPEAMMAAAPVTLNKQDEPIADFVFNAQNWAEDIALVRAMGFEVNNDNKSAPKNIPQPDQPLFCLGGGLHEGQEWEWDGIDQRATLGGAMYNGPSFVFTKGRSGDGTRLTSGPHWGELCTIGLHSPHSSPSPHSNSFTTSLRGS